MTQQTPTPKKQKNNPNRFWRVGVFVMLLHDAVDVLLEAAKVAKYCRAEDLATGIFAAFVVAWAALRLFVFPAMVVRSTLVELPAALGAACTRSMYLGVNLGLLVLLARHVYWVGLILRVVYLKLATGEGRDVREDDDDDGSGGD